MPKYYLKLSLRSVSHIQDFSSNLWFFSLSTLQIQNLAYHIQGPPWISTLLHTDLLQQRNIRPGLRLSSSSHILYVPKTRLASYGDRAFSSCAPRLWNSLPDELREDTPDLSTFKRNQFVCLLASGAFEWYHSRHCAPYKCYVIIIQILDA